MLHFCLASACSPTRSAVCCRRFGGSSSKSIEPCGKLSPKLRVGCLFESLSVSCCSFSAAFVPPCLSPRYCRSVSLLLPCRVSLPLNCLRLSVCVSRAAFHTLLPLSRCLSSAAYMWQFSFLLLLSLSLGAAAASQGVSVSCCCCRSRCLCLVPYLLLRRRRCRAP